MRSLSRPLSALFALWFAIVLGDPGVLHSCPMHGGHGAAHSAAMMGNAAAAHEGHVMHHAAAPASDASHHQDAPAPCTCLGHCCATPAAAPVPAVAAVLVPEAVAEVGHPLPAPSSDAPASPDRRLPFANGPPTA